MEKTISPSQEPITGGQIGKINELVAASLCKKKRFFSSKAVQEVLKLTGKAMTRDILAVIQMYTDGMRGLITHSVSVNRKPSIKVALDEMGIFYYTEGAYNEMPHGTTKETDVVFFNAGRYIKKCDLKKEYDIRGLKFADPLTLATVNKVNPEFTYKYPNITFWKNKKGELDDIKFYIRGELKFIATSKTGCEHFFWLAGIRK